MTNFQKGIVLALKEPGWQKFIKIPHSEIASYVELMNIFDIPALASTLKKFRSSQVKNYKNKAKTSYSYILTFQLLQDLKDNKKVGELFTTWGLENDEKIKAGKILAGLLSQQANKKTMINGTASAIPLIDVFQFFTAPKIQTIGFEKILSFPIGKLATGVGLFLIPTKTGSGADRVLETNISVGKVFVPKIVTNEMNFTEEDANKIEQEIALDQEADRLLKEADEAIQLDKDLEYEKNLKKQNNKTSWKKKVGKEVITKGIPIGVLGLVLKKGVETFGNMAPFFLAYMALDTLDNKKRGKK